MNQKFILFCVLFSLLICSQIVTAAHYLLGKVDDARDGTAANGHTVVLWNPSNGIQANITDVIGSGGNSGTDNYYMIDCEMLNSPCQVGQNLSIKVINSGDDYLSENVSVTVSGSGYDFAGDLRLNSPPNVTLISPVDYTNASFLVNFNCSASDLDSNLANVTLYGNWSGTWEANETKAVSGDFSSALFEKNITEGRYLWGCFVEDSLSVSSFSGSNHTLTVDLTSPVITSVNANISSSCGEVYTRINCSVTDALSGVNSVTIESIRPSGRTNYTASLLLGEVYYADLLINETGNWSFNCIVNDSSGNAASLNSSLIVASSDLPDLFVASSDLNFSNLNPFENEAVILNTVVYNLGCNNADNFPVSFYEGDPSLGGIYISHETISVAGLSNFSVNITWNAKIGRTNLFVYADSSGSIEEANDSNNKANRSINVFAWQEFYGEVSFVKTLPNTYLNNLTFWESLSGFVFVADMESNIDWAALESIGKNSAGETTSNDFSEIDSLLGMSGFDDSVSNVFTTDGITPKARDTFNLGGGTVEDVPIVNSTDNLNFVTGILWDKSDDNDGEYSQSDREDLIFATKVNSGDQGKYGIYDYEIKIPAKLREYDPTDRKEVYFYYDIS